MLEANPKFLEMCIWNRARSSDHWGFLWFAFAERIHSLYWQIAGNFCSLCLVPDEGIYHPFFWKSSLSHAECYSANVIWWRLFKEKPVVRRSRDQGMIYVELVQHAWENVISITQTLRGLSHSQVPQAVFQHIWRRIGTPFKYNIHTIGSVQYQRPGLLLSSTPPKRKSRGVPERQGGKDFSLKPRVKTCGWIGKQRIHKAAKCQITCE